MPNFYRLELIEESDDEWLVNQAYNHCCMCGGVIDSVGKTSGSLCVSCAEELISGRYLRRKEYFENILGTPGEHLRKTQAILAGHGPGPVEQARDILKGLANYQKGWNGPRSLGAHIDSFILADAFLQLVAHSNEIEQVEATIFSTGHAVLTFSCSDADVSIEFEPNGALAVNIDNQDFGIAEDLDLHFDGQIIPEQLAKYF